MLLTQASRYALYALACLARQGGGPLTTYHIAKENRLPVNFLAKVLKPLVSARVLVSMRGPYGGYRLDRRPEDVTVLEVVEAIDGPIRGAAPPPEPPSRRFPRYDPADAEWLHEALDELCKAAADRLRQSLGAVTLADLLESQPGCERLGS